MNNLFNYSDIVTRDEKTFIYDPSAAGWRVGQLDTIQRIHGDIFQMLQRSDYPATEDSCRAIASEGGAGLTRCIRDTTLSLIPDDAPKFWRKQQLETALSRVPDEMITRADELHRELMRSSDGVPVAPENMTFDPDQGIIIDADAVRLKIEAGCSWPVTDADKELAKEVLAAILELRRLRSKRINIKRLVDTYLGDPVLGNGYAEIPDIALYRAVTVGLMPTDGQIRANLALAQKVQASGAFEGLAVGAGFVPQLQPQPQAQPQPEPSSTPKDGDHKIAFLRQQGLL